MQTTRTRSNVSVRHEAEIGASKNKQTDDKVHHQSNPLHDDERHRSDDDDLYGPSLPNEDIENNVSTSSRDGYRARLHQMHKLLEQMEVTL